MRVTLETDGGIAAAVPGLNRPFTVDTSADLDATAGEDLARLVRAAKATHRHAAAGQVGRATGRVDEHSADLQTSRIVVEDGDAHYTLEYVDPIRAPEAGALIERLRALSRGDR